MHAKTFAAALAVLLTAGCGAASGSAGSSADRPRTATPSPSTSTSPNLDKSAVTAILADYDRRNNAAIARSAAADAGGWAAADSGALLVADRYQTAVAKALGEKKPGTPITSTADTFREGRDGRGRWLLTSMTRSGKRADGSSEPITSYGVLVPGAGTTGGTTGWTMEFDVGSYGPSRLLAPGSGVPTATQKQAVANSIANALYALGNGNTADFAFADPLADVRTFGFNATTKVMTTYDCSGWGDTTRAEAKTAPLLGTPAVRLMRAKAGSIAAVTLDCDWSAAAPENYDVWVADPIAELMKLPKGRVHSMRRPVVLQLLLVLPDRGKPSVIGANARYVLPR